MKKFIYTLLIVGLVASVCLPTRQAWGQGSAPSPVYWKLTNNNLVNKTGDTLIFVVATDTIKVINGTIINLQSLTVNGDITSISPNTIYSDNITANSTSSLSLSSGSQNYDLNLYGGVLGNIKFSDDGSLRWTMSTGTFGGEPGSNIMSEDFYKQSFGTLIPDSALMTKLYIDSIGGLNWNWTDSAGEPPFWVDTAKVLGGKYLVYYNNSDLTVLNIISDSSNIKFLEEGKLIYIQFGDSAFTLTNLNNVILSGPNAVNLAALSFYTDTAYLRGSLSIDTGLTIGAGNSATDYTFPSTDGSANYVLETNGSGVLSWVAQSGGGGSDADSIKGLGIQDTTGNLADNFILKYNLAQDSLMWEADVGAAGGTTDSIGIVFDAATKWQVDKAIKIDFGYGLEDDGVADSGATAVDTATIKVDTASLPFLHTDRQDTIYSHLYIVSNGDLALNGGSEIYLNNDGTYITSYIFAYNNGNNIGAYLRFDTLDDRWEINTGFEMLGDMTITGTVDGKDVSTLTDIGQTIETGEITDGTITEPDLNITNAGSDGQVLSKAGTQFTWITDSTGGGTADSIGIDTDGNGTVDNYLYSTTAGAAHIKKGSNITLTVSGDTVTIAGPSASGTADSIGVDTNGDGTVDGYMYSTTAGAAHIKKGNGILLVLDADTATISVDTAVAATINALVDSTATKLKLSGGTMTGGISMGAQSITFTDGDIYLNYDSTGGTGTIYFYDDGVANGAYISHNPSGSGGSQFTISDALDITTGDITLTGTVDGIDVSKLDSSLLGYPIDTVGQTFSDGDVLEWDVTNSEWIPVPQSGGSSPSLVDLYAYSDRDYFDTTTAFAVDSMFVKFSDSALGAQRATTDASGNTITSTYETITEVAKIGDDTVNYQTAYGWGDHSGLYELIFDDSGSWNILPKSIAKTGLLIGNASDTGIVDSNVATQGYVTGQGYITGNETITLSGDIGGSGATAITTTIQPNAVESTMIGVDQVNDLDINFGTGTDQVSTDDVTEGSTNKYDQALPDSANWSTAYGWGNHATIGYENYDDSGSYQEVPKSVVNTKIVIGNVADTAITDSVVLTKGTGDATYSATSHNHDATYETITNVGLIGDDTTNFKTAYDTVAAWDNGALDSTNIKDSSISRDDINWQGGINSARITDQTIVKVDIDTTTSMVWASAYKVTSSISDSALATIKFVRDSSLVDVDTNQTNFSTTTEIGAYIEDKTTDLTLTNATVQGDMEVIGAIKQWNLNHSLDTNNISFIHADTHLMISMPEQYWAADSSDRYEVIHPSVVYVPQGLFGYKYHLACTPYPSANYENPTYRVSNDNITWNRFISGTDSCPDPIYEQSACSLTLDVAPPNDTLAEPSYLSDTKMFYGHDGKLRIVWRATYGTSGANQNALWSSYTIDGFTWSTPVNILPIDSTRDYISPAVILDSTGTYKMWVMEITNGESNDSQNVVVMYQSTYADSNWTIVDSCDVFPFYGGVSTPIYSGATQPTESTDSTLNAQLAMWHLDVLKWSPDEYIMLLTCTNNQNYTPPALFGAYPLMIAKSRDGLNWKTRYEPILQNNNIEEQLYKSAAIIVETGRERTLGLYYTGTYLNINDSSHINYTEGFFYDTLIPVSINFWEFYDIGSANRDSTSVITNLMTHDVPSISGKYIPVTVLNTSLAVGTWKKDTLFFIASAPKTMYIDSLKYSYWGVDATMDILDVRIMVTNHPIGSDTLFYNIPNYDITNDLRWYLTERIDGYGGWRRKAYKLTDTGVVYGISGDSLFAYVGDNILIRMIAEFNQNDSLAITGIELSGREAWRTSAMANGFRTGSQENSYVSQTESNRRKNRYVPFIFVHGNNTIPGDSVELSLEGRDAGATYGWLFRDSTLIADQTDTVLLSLILPWGSYRCDSLVFKYQTSSDVITTSNLTSERLTVGTNSLWSSISNYFNTSETVAQVSINSTGFDAGQPVNLELIFEGDADQWLKIYYAYLVLSET